MHPSSNDKEQYQGHPQSILLFLKLLYIYGYKKILWALEVLLILIFCCLFLIQLVYACIAASLKYIFFS